MQSSFRRSVPLALGAAWFSLFLIPVVALALPSPMLHPNLARGDSGFEFERHTVGKVNTFNGNLRVTIPMGHEYPVSSRLGYRLALEFNSNFWDVNDSGPAGISVQPAAASRAGMGWDLSFGRLIPPGEPGNSLGQWIYIEPDGSAHPFYDTLREDLPATVDTFYSRDGSYLRLSKVTANLIELDEPDGTTRRFEFYPSLNEWRVRRVEDIFDQGFEIQYGATRTTVSDDHGREHHVDFVTDPSGVYAGLVGSVDLEVFSGDRAVYSMAYESRSISRWAIDEDPGTPSKVTVPMLASVTLPDGTAYTMDYGSVGGRLVKMQLPTLGQVQWGYRTWGFTNPGCAHDLLPAVQANTGIGEYIEKEADGTELGRWGYSHWMNGDCPAARLNTRMVTPDLDQIWYFFTGSSTAASLPEGSYGQPGAIDLADTNASTELIKKKSYVECDASGNNCDLRREVFTEQEVDEGSQTSGYDPQSVNRREVENRTYYDDYLSGDRVWRQVSRGGFNGLGKFRDFVRRSNFGRADHFTAETVWTVEGDPGGFPAVGESWVLSGREEERRVEGSSSIRTLLCTDPATGVILRERKLRNDASPSSDDVLIEYAYDAEGEKVMENYHSGDLPTSGDLCALSVGQPQYQKAHTYAHGVRSATYWLDTDGSVLHQTLDLAPDPSTGWPAAARDEAGRETQYEYDLLGRTVRESHPDGHGDGFTRYIYRPRDPETDLYTTTYRYAYAADGQILRRSYEQADGFGRPAREAIVYEHNDAGQRKWKVKQREFDSMSRVAAETDGYANVSGPLGPGKRLDYGDYDVFGRPGRLTRADGSTIDLKYFGVRATRTTYSKGLYYTSSNGVVAKDINQTTYYDGRLRPYRTVRDVYEGPDWSTVARYDIVDRVLDGAGRVVTVVENQKLVEEASYDGLGNLVERSRTLPGWAGTLNRYTERYFDHDALGNALRKETSRPTGGPSVLPTVVANRTFDRAGRLVQVDGDDGFRWRHYVYGTHNQTLPSGATTWRRGRLVLAERASLNVGKVKELYTYGGYGGAISRYETEVVSWRSSFPSNTYVQEYEYDELGRRTYLGFTPGSDEPGYSIDWTYDAEHVDTVTGWDDSGTRHDWITDAEYNWNGGLSRLEYGNGTAMDISYANSIVRPHEVSLTGLRYANEEHAWSTGDFAYDGAGWAVRIGESSLVGSRVGSDSSSSAPSANRFYCWEESVDPNDGRAFTRAGEYCSEIYPLWLRSSRGRSLVQQDQGSSLRVNLYDVDGNLVWTARQYLKNNQSAWEYKAHVQSEGQAVGEWSKVQDWTGVSERRVFHHGGTTQRSDQDGTWITYREEN